jgi:hypothetical protein
MAEPAFQYFGTQKPVQVGDRILVRPLFGRARLATVVYIPGQSSADTELGDDQWAYRFDDGGIYAAGYSPAQIPHPGKRIEFVSRPGDEAREVIESYRIPPEKDQGQPGRDFLALIGCGTIVLVVILLVGMASAWLLGKA